MMQKKERWEEVGGMNGLGRARRENRGEMRGWKKTK